MARLAALGVAPPYHESATAGLVIRGADGEPLYDSVSRGSRLEKFEEIPPLLADTLVYLENRELPAPPRPYSNPAIEWDRMAKAAFYYAGSKLGFRVPIQGGSTLATQIEKFRHSPHGRTDSVAAKLRQVAGASLRAYRGGSDTRLWRREILLDYLNTMPLSGTREYGEIDGLGNGLHAWFGMDLANVCRALFSTTNDSAKVEAYKHVLALFSALPAPTTYLVQNRSALDERVSFTTRLLVKGGIIDVHFGRALESTPIRFAGDAPIPPPGSFADRKALTAVRAGLTRLLGLSDFYELDGLHLEARSTIDPFLQNAATKLFQQVGDPAFVAANGWNGERLLQRGDPQRVIYSLMLFERTPDGNALRVHADNLDQPLDINDGIKMELGSTAKLRTIAHYLEIVTELHSELSGLKAADLAERIRRARDPLTRWALEALGREPGLGLEAFLERALDRRYSASPYETFFTGGGIHTFENFSREDNIRVLSVREALRTSTNLVFIRLMRDLVRFHQARLPYDPEAVLHDPKNTVRRRLLTEIAENEGLKVLHREYRKYRIQSADALISLLLGSRATAPRALAILFFATHPGGDEAALGRWLTDRLGTMAPEETHRLFSAYGNPRLTIADYGFLLNRHPLDLWSASELLRSPDLSWQDFLARSGEAREEASAWLFKTRHRGAQDLRLRIQIEKDAFARMTPYWQRLGFPFDHLVPSYATAIGNSSDRPAALAALMGIILNGGIRRASLQVTGLHFAAGTPYETSFTLAADPGERVLAEPVARAIRSALAEVVTSGTARRLSGAFVRPDGSPLAAGGKTGSGDNRFKTFDRYGGELSSKAVNRTATFVFYVGDRYFGALTAFVPGREAERYGFTSALPVALLKSLAPAISQRLAGS